MFDLNSYELLNQLSYLFEIQDHLLTSGLIGVFYLFYHQLGIAAHLQLIYFHEVGEVESSYDSLIFGLVIGGLEADSEGVYRVYPVWRGQDQPCTASLGVSGPVDE